MASRWEVLAQVMDNINDTDDYGLIKDLKEVMRLCHLFDDGAEDEYGPGYPASTLAEAIFDVLSNDYTQSAWDEAGSGWSGHNKRVEAANSAAQTGEDPNVLMPGAVDAATGRYNPNDEAETIEAALPPLNGGDL